MAPRFRLCNAHRPRNINRTQSRHECTGSGVNKCSFGFWRERKLNKGSIRVCTTNFITNQLHPPARAIAIIAAVPLSIDSRYFRIPIKTRRHGPHQTSKIDETHRGTRIIHGQREGCFIPPPEVNLRVRILQREILPRPALCSKNGAERAKFNSAPPPNPQSAICNQRAAKRIHEELFGNYPKEQLNAAALAII